MIKANFDVFAVIGDPISHSLSPVMQNWMINYFGLDAIYTAFHVKHKDLMTTVEAMRALGIKGLNVTVPHKEFIYTYADQISDTVRLLGAANTLKNKEGIISAFVTDPYGFMESVKKDQEEFYNANVFLFGAGGAAKSVAFALSKLKIKKLICFDVVDEKVKNLIKTCKRDFKIPETFIFNELNVSLNDALEDSTIIINATPVGMVPNQNTSVLKDYAVINSNHFVYDLVYNPGKTKLLLYAEKRGAKIQNGLDMLIFQGLESLRIWTEKDLQLSQKKLYELGSIMYKELSINE